MASNLVQAIISVKDLNFSSGLQKATTQLEIFSNSANGVCGKIQNFGNQIQNFGKNVKTHLSGIGKDMMIAGAATTAMGFKAVKSFGQFQQSLNTAAVVAGGTSKDIKGLADVANKMGADLPISAQDAANAMIEMAKNGASLKDLKSQFPAISKAATAAGSDLQATAGVVQLAMNVWGKSLKSPARAAEYLVKTANLSNASVEDMQEVIGTIGPTANLAGYGMRDMSTAIGLVTNKGMSAANAAQDLNFAMLKMMAPTKSSASAMKALGLSVRDAQGNMRPLKNILIDVANATQGMSKAQRDAVLKQLWGTAGMKAMIPLLDSVKDKTNNTSTSWDAFSNALDKAAGSTAKANKALDMQASDMQRNIGAKVEQLGGNWESLRNSVMQSNQGMTGSILDVMNNTLNWAQNSNSALAKVTRGFIALSPVIGPVMTAVGGFLTNFSKITTVVGGTIKVIGKAGAGIFQLTGKLFGIGSGASKAASSMAATSKVSEQLGNATQRSSDGAQKAKTNYLGLSAVILSIGASIGMATAGMALLVSQVTKLASTGSSGAIAMTAVGVSLVALVGSLALVAKHAQGSAVGLAALGASALAITSGMALLVSQVTKLASTGQSGAVAMAAVGVSLAALTATLALVAPMAQAGSVGLLALGAAVLMITSGMALLVTSVTGLVTALGTFNTTGQQVVSILTSIGAGMGMMVTNFIVTLATQLPQIVQAFLQSFVQIQTMFATYLPQFIKLGIKTVVNIINGITQGLPQLISATAKLIVTFLQSLTKELPRIIKAGAQFIVSLCTGLAQEMPQIITSAVNLITSFVDSLTKNLDKLITSGAKFIVSLLNGIAKKLPDIIKAAVNVIVKFVEGIANNLGKIVDAGINLLAKFLDAITTRIPKLATVAVQAVMKFVYGVGNALGQVLASGGKLILVFIKGVIDGLSGSKNAGTRNANGVKNAIANVSLFNIGKDLIQGFIRGMFGMIKNVVNTAIRIGRAAVNTVKKFLHIGSPSRVMRDEVGKWVPAGMAIGMERNIGVVDDAATAISKAAMVTLPSVNTNSFTRSLNAINGANLQTAFQHELQVNTQPAYISMSLGGTDYEAFVDNISQTQDQQIALRRKRF